MEVHLCRKPRNPISCYRPSVHASVHTHTHITQIHIRTEQPQDTSKGPSTPKPLPDNDPRNKGTSHRLQFGSALWVLAVINHVKETLEHLRLRPCSNLSRKSPLDSKDERGRK